MRFPVERVFCCDRKSRAVCAQSLTLWQQATIEIPRRNHSIIACSRHLYLVLFFTHIPFVVNPAFNATPPERLQQCDTRSCAIKMVHFIHPESWARGADPGQRPSASSVGEHPVVEQAFCVTPTFHRHAPLASAFVQIKCLRQRRLS